MHLERNSPCKVNFLLNILGKRPDGYHELETVLQPVPVCDRLCFSRPGRAGLPEPWERRHPAGSVHGITLTCDHPGLPVDSRNLVWRAAAAFLEAAQITEQLIIHLEKKVPLAAGLGGGSSNAAHTLAGLNELFGQPLGLDRLQQIAAGLGSDVPFFLQGKPALGLGRGERIVPLEPFAALRGYWMVLIHPGFGIETAWAYQELARFPEARQGRPGRAQELIERLSTGGMSAARAHFYNSLEAPALRKYPILKLYQEFFQDQGASASLMSGSGSSTFALAENRELAQRMVEGFKSRFGTAGWVACVPLLEAG